MPTLGNPHVTRMGLTPFLTDDPDDPLLDYILTGVIKPAARARMSLAVTAAAHWTDPETRAAAAELQRLLAETQP